MTTTTKAKSAQRKFVKPDFVNTPLATLFSTRVRLTDEERSKLKEAYNKAYHASFTPNSNPNIGGSTIQVETQYGSSYSLDQKLGMNRICAVDIIQSRDSIALPIILKFQKVLNIEIITAERLEKAFKDYVNYVFTVD